MVKKKSDDGFIKNVVRKKFIRRKHELLNKHSDAERRFIDLLINANLYFIREKCSFKYSRWCYYDFYLPLTEDPTTTQSRRRLMPRRTR